MELFEEKLLSLFSSKSTSPPYRISSPPTALFSVTPSLHPLTSVASTSPDLFREFIDLFP
jgi:hypothetical protein